MSKMQYVGNVSQFIAYNSARVIMIKYKMYGVAFSAISFGYQSYPRSNRNKTK